MKIDRPVYFIKLGMSGAWEDECLNNGILRFGYHDTPHQSALDGDWEAVHRIWLGIRKGNRGTATRDVSQIRIFYTAPKAAIFITFARRRLYWCHAAPGVVEDPSDDAVNGQGSRIRRTVDGWHCESRGKNPLTIDRLSGRLTRVRGFMGTICNVDAADYLMRKIDDAPHPYIAAAETAEIAMLAALQGLIRELTWEDFEVLVDLIFSQSGWRRLGATGGTQKTIDLELLLPSTQERAYVQVKSAASQSTLNHYLDERARAHTDDRMFFAWHTGTLKEDQTIPGITLLGPNALARMALDAGLSTWLRDKVL